MLITGCCLAATETVKVPAIETWNIDKKVEFLKLKEGWWLKDGKLEIPGKYTASYGDSVLITMHHTGKGQLIVRLKEFNADGKLLVAWNYCTFINKTGEDRTYSPTYDISNKETKYYTLTLESSQNPNMVIKDFTVSRTFGPVQKLYSPVLSADHWREVTKGENLAKGLKVKFYPTPNRVATNRGGTDETDLTDGKLSMTYGNYIYDDQKSVGWQHPRLEKCAFSLDLGSVQPIDKMVMRICGGRLNGTKGGSAGMFPELIEVWISRDAKNWHKTSSLQKLQINEKDDADWKTLYYLPESNINTPPYVYPFQLGINAEARYIYVNFKTAYYIFSMDQIAVMKGTPDAAGFNDAYKSVPIDILKKQAVMTPYYSEFYVPRNVNVPNFFRFDDNRDVKPESDIITYTVDLPSQVVLIPENELAYQIDTRTLAKKETKNGRTLFHFTQPYQYKDFVKRADYEIGPFYFRAQADVPEAEKYMKVTTFASGKQCGEVRMKLNVIDIPEVPRLKHLLMAGTWFTSRLMLSWPDVMNSVRHVGLNALSVHDKLTPKNAAYLKAARENGFKIIGAPDNLFMNTWKKTAEIHCDSWNKVASHNNICPVYRGKYYQELCDEVVEKRMKTIAPDYIHLDYEFWFSPETFVTCTHCEALRKSKNMGRAEYAEWAMADSYKDVLLAARRAAPNAKIGSYLYCADRLDDCGDEYVSLFGAKRLFPKYLDELHTGYYGTNVKHVQEAARANYLYTRDPKRVLIYLSAGNGAYGTEEYGVITLYSLLEAYMNGAYGIAYFVDRALASPVDYFYVASGLKAIAPYDEFLVKATLDEKFKGSDPDLTYTLRKLGKDALVLVGNYNPRKDATTFLSLPDLKSAVDCITGETVKIQKNGIDLKVGKNNVKFLKLTFQ